MTKKKDTPTQAPRVLFDPATSEWVVVREYLVFLDEDSARASAGGG